MRCYFMRDGHIASVEFLESTTDRERVVEAEALFNIKARDAGCDGFEVWDGPRFVYRYPPDKSHP
jgi:hypothetical protein